MLKGVVEDERSITEVRDKMAALVPYRICPLSNPNYRIHGDKLSRIAVSRKSEKYEVDKLNVIEDKLVGIKGQYLIFENGVSNIRSQAGARVSVEW